MRMMNKIFNIVLIFMLIGVFLCPDFVFAENMFLRVPSLFQPSKFSNRIKEISEKVQENLSLPPRVSIIILHYGKNDRVSEKYTLKLLHSLENLDYSNYEIILIDNGSPDGFFSKYKNNLPEKFPKLPKVTFIKSKVNLGCAEGQNLGMEHALKNKSDYFFLLDNNIIIDRDSLTKLIKKAESSKDIGIVGPMVYDYYQSNLIQHAGGKFLKSPIGNGEIDHGQYDFDKEVDFVFGAAKLVKRDVFEKVGGMAKEIFIYYDEVEWAIRIRKAGYKCVFVPAAKISHVGNIEGSERYTKNEVYFRQRNKFYIMKHYPELRSLALRRLLIVELNAIKAAIFYKDINRFISTFRGIYDGMLSRFNLVERGEIDIVTFDKDMRPLSHARQMLSINDATQIDL